MDERQLHLFKGKRQRGVTLPPPLEFKMHVALVALLRHALLPNWWYTHIPAGEYRDKVTASRLKAMGLKPGCPDFMFIGPNTLFFLELKRKGEKPSEAQREVAAMIKACGFLYHLSDTLDDAIFTLSQMSIIRTTR
jgi:VRR-NUC domain.